MALAIKLGAVCAVLTVMAAAAPQASAGAVMKCSAPSKARVDTQNANGVVYRKNAGREAWGTYHSWYVCSKHAGETNELMRRGRQEITNPQPKAFPACEAVCSRVSFRIGKRFVLMTVETSHIQGGCEKDSVIETTVRRYSLRTGKFVKRVRHDPVGC